MANQIAVYCDVEDVVVGHILLDEMAKSDVMLGIRFLSEYFVPIDQEHRLSQIKNKKYLKCSKCYGNLVLKGEVKTDESDKVLKIDGIRIIVGSTKLQVS